MPVVTFKVSGEVVKFQFKKFDVIKFRSQIPIHACSIVKRAIVKMLLSKLELTKNK